MRQLLNIKIEGRENQPTEEQQKTLLETMQLSFCAVSLWTQATGLKSSEGRSEEDVREEISDRKKELRALFDNLIEAGQLSFLDRLTRALNLP